MAAEMTETVYNVSPNLGGKVIKFEFVGAEDDDWVIFDDPIGCVKATLPTGADAATVYAVGATATVADATATTLTGAEFEVNQRPTSGYITIGTEIVKYSGATKTSATGNLTLDARGCFGTTAAAHAGVTCYVLNTVVFSLGTLGLVRGIADIIGE